MAGGSEGGHRVESARDAAPDSPSEGGSDAADGRRNDASDAHAGRHCTWTQTFGAAGPLPPSIDTPDHEDSFSLSDDGLSAYLARAPLGSGHYDLYITTRFDLGSDFGTPTLLEGPINTSARERQPSISADGLLLFYSDDSDILVAARNAKSTVFGRGSLVANINDSTARDSDPFISAEGKTLYFSSSRSGSGDIFSASLAPDGQFTAVKPVDTLNTDATEGAPVLSHDQLTIYYEADRPTSEIWVAHRDRITDPFGAGHAVAELKKMDIEWPESISTDGCTLYFVGRPLGGAYDIYSASYQ